MKNTGVKRKRVNKKKVDTKKKVNVNKVKRHVNLYSDKIKNFVLGMTKGSSKTIFANLPQSIVYLLIWILLAVSSWAMSVLFWSPNVKIDKDSIIGLDIDLLFSDINGIVMFVLITGLELFKLNDSLTALRLEENNKTYGKTKVLARVFLSMSVIASISFLSIDKELYADITPIKAIVYTFISLFTEFKLEVFLSVFLGGLISAIVEIGILEIPVRLKVIWFGDKVNFNTKKSLNIKGKIKKYMRKGKEFISNRGKDNSVINIDNLKNTKIKDTEKVDKTSSLDINNRYNNENEDLKSNDKVIDLNKKVKLNDNEGLKKKYKNNIDLGIVNKAIEYLEKIKGDKDKIKIKVEDIKLNIGIDHNKWQFLRDKLVSEGYVIQTGKRTFYYIGKKKRKFNMN